MYVLINQQKTLNRLIVDLNQLTALARQGSGWESFSNKEPNEKIFAKLINIESRTTLFYRIYKYRSS